MAQAGRRACQCRARERGGPGLFKGRRNGDRGRDARAQAAGVDAASCSPGISTTGWPCCAPCWARWGSRCPGRPVRRGCRSSGIDSCSSFADCKFQKRDESQITAMDVTRIDLCWSAVAGLSMSEPIRGADFQTRGLLLALRAGEPLRIARALAMEAGHRATAGARPRRGSRLLLESGRADRPKRSTRPTPAA